MDNDFDFDWDFDEAQPDNLEETPQEESFDKVFGTPDEIEEGKEPEEDKEETPEEPSEETAPEVDLIPRLKALGVIPEDSDVTEDILPDYLDSNFDKEVEDAVIELMDSWKDTLSEDGLKFIEYSRSGGTMEDYIKTYSELPIHHFDVSNEGGQESFLRYYLGKYENRSAEEINDNIDFYIERDSLERAAKSAYSRLQTARDTKVQQLHDSQVQSKREQEQAVKEQQNQLKTSLKEVEEVAGYKFTGSEKTLLSRYITKPSVKVGDRYVSEFFHKIQDVYNNDPQKLLLLAKLAKSDFDISFLEREAASKATKKAKEIINEPRTKSKAATPKVIWEF